MPKKPKPKPIKKADGGVLKGAGAGSGIGRIRNTTATAKGTK